LKLSALNKSGFETNIPPARQRAGGFFFRIVDLMKHFLDTFCNVLRVLLGCLVASLAIPVSMQVIARYTGIIPVYLWTEELATFIFVWVVMIGATVAVWDGNHFDVRVLPDARTPLGKLLQDGVVLVMITAFALIFAWYGIEYAQFGAKQHSVMMRANMMITFISVPLAGVAWTMFASYRLFEAIAEFRKTKKDTA
jgi:TRAP-type C4-dicarboxylate transport system permease small subunit